MKKFFTFAICAMAVLFASCEKNEPSLDKDNPSSGGETMEDSISNTTNDHEYVDLGLSVKWATCNVGANKPEDYGDYFAWGELAPKTTYNWSYSYTDNPTTLPLANDAACANWGGRWRMPTKDEQDELREQCTWNWTSQNGVNGYKVTSKKNGKSIFLPAAGFRSYSSLSNEGSYGHYWSSSLNADNLDHAYELDFGSDNVGRDDDNRYFGLSVRPVCQ